MELTEFFEISLMDIFGDYFKLDFDALTIYNGKFYAGSIPYAQVYRYEGGGKWTLMNRFFHKKVYSMPGLGDDAKARAKLTGLTVYDGKLFAGVGSCTSSIQNAPCDVRGKAFCMEAGKNISYDHDLGSGWKHITAVRENGKLKLYIDGKLTLAWAGWITSQARKIPVINKYE